MPPAEGDNGKPALESMPAPSLPAPALAPVIESSIFYKDIVEPYWTISSRKRPWPG